MQEPRSSAADAAIPVAPGAGPAGRRTAIAILAGLIVLHLVLSTGKTVAAFAHSYYDDLLYQAMAESIVRTGWLGPYGELTMIKPPGYSLFLAANYILGTPVLLAEQLLHAAAGLLFLRALRPLLPDLRWRVAIFAVYLFDPTATMGSADHLIRETIYTSLAVIVAACGVGAFGAALQGRAAAAWSVGLGLAGALFWITREEGVWLVPTVALLGAGAAWAAWRRSPRAMRRRRLAGLAAAIPAFAALNLGHAAIHYGQYGVFATSEYRSGPFREAYTALLRVRQPVDEPFILVPAIVRQAIYRESPAFRSLAPSLERDWIGSSCRTYPNPHACGDLPGYSLLWAVRTAAAKTGHFASPAAMRQFFTTLAREVNDACAAGRLDCLPPRRTLMPPRGRAWVARHLPQALYRAVRLVVLFTGTGPEQVPSRPDEPFRDRVARFTHNEVAPAEGGPPRRPGDVTGVAGWVYLPDHSPFSVHLQAAGAPLPIAMQRTEGSDVAAHFGDAAAHGLRFALAGDCPSPCRLVVLAGDRATFLPLEAAGPGAHRLAAPDGTLYLDRISRVGAAEAADDLPAWPRRLKLGVLSAIQAGYRIAGPWLLLIGLLAHLACGIALLRGARSALFLVSTALLAGAATLATVIALIEATAYPLISPHYLQPCYAFALLFALLALANAAGMVRRRAAGPGGPGRPG
ncbi:MAG: hypothetical protein U1E53_35150 [Dongiaceae bacterium]